LEGRTRPKRLLGTLASPHPESVTENETSDIKGLRSLAITRTVIPDKPRQRRRSGIHRRAPELYDGFRSSAALRPE